MDPPAQHAADPAGVLLPVPLRGGLPPLRVRWAEPERRSRHQRALHA
jgi:hypothetical protein